MIVGQLLKLKISQTTHIPDLVHEILVEFCFNASNRVKDSVFSPVDIVEGSTAIKPILALWIIPHVSLAHLENTLTQVDEIILCYILNNLFAAQIKKYLRYCHHRMHIVKHQIVCWLLRQILDHFSLTMRNLSQSHDG